MTKTSGYPQARDRILTHIAEMQPKQIDRADVTAMAEVSISTAGTYLMRLAAEFPENLTYVRGVLIVKSAFPESRLPPETRLHAKNRQIQRVKQIMGKIKANHLKHNDIKELKKVLKEAQQEIDKL